MTASDQARLQQRVEQAADSVLARDGSAGPLEVFQEMRLLAAPHLAGWRKGNEPYRVLRPWIQAGAGKFSRTVHYFQAWAQARGLRPLEVPHVRQGPGGLETLAITEDGDPECEKFFRTRYVPADLSAAQSVRLTTKLTRPPELVVFQKVSEEGQCGACGADLLQGDLLLMDKGRPLCLACAKLDQLVFLPAGDAALSRRARKHSPQSAVVVRFSRTRRRYERQGLLVTPAALNQARAETAPP
jgi:hypothetical protein